MEELLLAAEWEDEVREYAGSWGVPKDEMREIWLRAIGPRLCTCAEHMSVLLEELPRPDDLGSSD
ncbi:MAG: hypothetical protein IH989_03330 [Planctomycetes bacterium]|nr:hypothetical protein [Planctomycetota bacterium]